ncbi:MAG: EamA family transporter RarD [Pirellulaceae bacterium]|nr:EamA family transporter RarD [Pirellulaceae bacterium]
MNYLQALAAYVLWGVFPLYWKLLSGVNSFEVICHRIIWSLVTLILCVSLVGQWPEIRRALRDPRRLGLTVFAACLISLNWLVFIWAVQHGAVVQASLGYFINPLLNVLLGVMIFGERLSRNQWWAVSLAAVGLMIVTISTGSVSWIALSLASSFAAYAAVKKKTSLPAIAGLGLETAVLLPLAVAYLIWVANSTAEVKTTNTLFLLSLGGPITTLPLVLFAAAAKSVPLAVMGMLQYIAPSLQFLVGFWLYQEPIGIGQFVGFACVWCALAILTYEMLSRKPVPADA